MDGNDVGMFELARDLSLLDKAGLLAGVGLVEKVLDGDFPADVAIHGPQDGSHAASGNFALDGVSTLVSGSSGQQLLDGSLAGSTAHALLQSDPAIKADLGQ